MYAPSKLTVVDLREPSDRLLGRRLKQSFSLQFVQRACTLSVPKLPEASASEVVRWRHHGLSANACLSGVR
jgi:hypothetical protein